MIVRVEMFTGIIEKTSVVKSIVQAGDEYRLTVRNPFRLEISGGDSIAVDGTCLTVEKFSNEVIEFFISKITAQKTIAAKYKAGTVVNLERAMKVESRFDGHIVQGHIDTTGTVAKIEKRGLGIEVAIKYDTNFSNLVVSGGSIAVNGVSLTTAIAKEGEFTVSLIPETLKRSSFFNLKTGTALNLEFDIIGKYVDRLIKKNSTTSNLGHLLEKL